MKKMTADNHDPEPQTPQYPKGVSHPPGTNEHTAECIQAPGSLFLACRPRKMSDIPPQEFLRAIESALPEAHGLLSAILNDDELWPIFRQRAAAAFCREDASSFLEGLPGYPFCFACPTEVRPYSGQYKRVHHWFYTFHDLAALAQKVIDGQPQSHIPDNKAEIKKGASIGARCWICEAVAPGEALCPACSSRASELIEDGLAVCRDCCICDDIEALNIKPKEKNNAAS